MTGELVSDVLVAIRHIAGGDGLTASITKCQLPAFRIKGNRPANQCSRKSVPCESRSELERLT